MNRDELETLPEPVFRRVLLDALDDETTGLLERAEKPEVPRKPKYDRKIYKQGAFYWASETTFSDLEWLHNRAASGANDPKWGEKNAKQAQALKRWVDWRRIEPDAVWSGIRDDRDVTGAAPNRNPQMHDKDAPPDAGPAPDLDRIPF